MESEKACEYNIKQVKQIDYEAGNKECFDSHTSNESEKEQHGKTDDYSAGMEHIIHFRPAFNPERYKHDIDELVCNEI